MRAPDHNEMYYLKFTVLSIAWFMALHVAVHILTMRHAQVYKEMSNSKRTEYRTYVLSIIHAIGCVVLSTIAMFYICGDGKTVFNNDECMNTVRYVHIWALIHSCGYFLTDFFFLAFVIQGRSTLDYQTYAHHLVAVTTYYQTLYFMDFMCVFGCMLLFIEISTPFVSARWLLFTHGMSESPLYALNALLTFITFLFGRIVYQFYIVIFYGAAWVYAEYSRKNLTVYQGFVITEMAIMVILSIMLNSYWMWLMIKMIGRVISRAMKPKDEDENLEKVELVKADALAIDNEADCGSSTQGSNMGEIAEEG